MDKTTYENVKNLPIKGLPLHKCASWALWNQSNGDDTEIIEKSISKLNPNIIFLGLNFAGDKLIINRPDWTPWKNFHFAGSRADMRAKKILTGTQYEGAYMTDIVKYVPTRTAAELLKKIDNGEVRMEEHIKIFIEEINS
jgi:hypothetical protein